VGLVWSMVVFGGINWVALARRAWCFDCGFARGVPFILFYDAGFPLMPARIDWIGLLADALVATASGFLLALMIHAVYLRYGSK
jgi:hypothetical protein